MTETSNASVHPSLAVEVRNASLIFNPDEAPVHALSDIDLAIKTAMGYAMGPMELLDLVGMDTQKLLCEALHGVTNEPRAACPPLVKRMIAAGWLGKKTGRGLLRYADSKMFGA